MDNDELRVVHPGPIDPSVLTLQADHRSTHIWAGNEFESFTCRRADSFLEAANIDYRLLPYLINAGFYGVCRIGVIKYDWSLVSAMVERWREETHTFHLRIGEATITLQDVGVILGLPIEGNAVTSREPERTKEQWQELCFELLGAIPSSEHINGQRLNMGWLTQQCTGLGADATEVQVQQHARSFIFALIGGYLLPGVSGNKVNLRYLPLLRDIYDIGNFSWGSATLAYLYHELCRATKPSTSQIGGCLTLLQIWVWERLRCMRPSIRDVPDVDPPGPAGYKWSATKLLRNLPTHVLRVYRDQLDRLTEEQFVWQPYVLEDLPAYCIQGLHSWRSEVPLICFEKVELHFPDRVLRQFGMLQGIPNPCDTRTDLHRFTLRGGKHKSWADVHQQHIAVWENRHQRVVEGFVGVERMTYVHPYMVWYRSITRVLIGNPHHMSQQRDDIGYRGIAGGFEALVQQLQRMDILLAESAATYEDPNVVESRRLLATALTLVGEHERLTGEAPPVPLHNDPAPQMQQARRRRPRPRREAPAPDPSSPPVPTTDGGAGPSTSHAERTHITPAWYTHHEGFTPGQYTQHDSQVDCVTQVGTSQNQADAEPQIQNTDEAGPSFDRYAVRFSRQRRNRRAPSRYTPQ